MIKIIEANKELRFRRASLIMTFNMIKGNTLIEEIVYSHNFVSSKF